MMRAPFSLRTVALALLLVLLAWLYTDWPASIGASDAPQLLSPAKGAAVMTLGPTLQWSNPAGKAQYQIPVLPIGGDGPGINLMRNVATSFTIPAPRLGVGDYLMLPGMSYLWKVRASGKATFAPENDPSCCSGKA